MTSITEIVANDLCIGCGLCESVTQGRVQMTMTEAGSLRPSDTNSFSAIEERLLMQVCPGTVAEARTEPAWTDRAADPVWGTHGTIALAWAADAQVRFESATGGVLSALGMFLVDTGVVKHIVHVGADPAKPMRSATVTSSTAASVLQNAGSRYGPTSPLRGFMQALDRGETFAVVAKPCDLGAVHRVAQIDPRVDELCIARLAMVCGGSSRLSKSQALLAEFDVDEAELSTFRYRGYGNPGPTVVETTDGRRFEKTYLELWEDETSWQIETRCKLCPDALGEAADISAADAWPGGAPTGEDEGFNVVVVRSVRGEQILADSVEAGYLVQGDSVGPREFDALQPHQERKKRALASRYDGMADAGVTPIKAIGLRVQELGSGLTDEQALTERNGTHRRLSAIRRNLSR